MAKRVVSENTVAKDSNDLTMVVSLPRNVICESTDATEIKLSITDNDSVVTQVSMGGGILSQQTLGEGSGKSGSKKEGDGTNKTDELPDIHEYFTAVNEKRHKACGHGIHKVTECKYTAFHQPLEGEEPKSGESTAGSSKQKSAKSSQPAANDIPGKLDTIVDRFDSFQQDLTKKMDSLNKRVTKIEKSKKTK